MVDYKSSPASPKSPDHDYFPKHLFRRSKASDEVPPSPISGRAAGKARAQQSSPLIQLQSQTPVAPAFPTPVHPNSQQYHTSQQQQRGPYSYIPLNLDDRNQDRLSQTHNLLSDAPLEDENAKHYSYASTYSPEIKSAEEADQEVREAQMKRARKWQKIDKYIGYTLGLISLTLSLMMDAILAYVLHTFYKTKDIPAPGRVGPWAVGTQLWPAYMLLAASSVTFLVDGSTLVAACCVLRSERKRKGKEKSKADGEKVVAARAESALVKAGYVAFVAKWFIIATLYRTGKTSKDLWGWSCDKRAANIQKYYVNDLNFATLCRAQVSYISSLCENSMLTMWLDWSLGNVDHGDDPETLAYGLYFLAWVQAEGTEEGQAGRD